MDNHTHTAPLSDTKKNIPPGEAVRWQENKYIPTLPVLKTPEEKEEFLKMYIDNDAWEATTCKKYGVSQRTLRRRKVEDREFAEALADIRRGFDKLELSDLEGISSKRAKDPKATTERIFRMNALNPAKYRPKPQSPAVPNIHITFGFQRVTPKTMSSQRRNRKQDKAETIQADYEVAADRNDGEKPPEANFEVNI